MMNKISKASIENIPEIVAIAYKTWFKTYENIISKEQIDFMFGEMYTPEALFKQMDFLGHEFYLLYVNNEAKGFASISEMIHEEEKTFKIHKLYFLPECQGMGLGKEMLNFLENVYLEKGAKYIILNVNRNNPAFNFYKKLNYTIRETIDIPYGDFWLNDYVMEKTLK